MSSSYLLEMNPMRLQLQDFTQQDVMVLQLDPLGVRGVPLEVDIY